MVFLTTTCCDFYICICCLADVSLNEEGRLSELDDRLTLLTNTEPAYTELPNTEPVLGSLTDSETESEQIGSYFPYKVVHI